MFKFASIHFALPIAYLAMYYNGNVNCYKKKAMNDELMQ